MSAAPSSRAVDLSALVLRVAFGGGMLALHGLPKLQKVLDGDLGFADPLGLGATTSLYLAVFSELVCGALVVLGVATRAATIPLAFTMIVAAFIVHGGDPIGDRELGLAYLAGYVAILALGPGRLAVSSAWASALEKRPAAVRWLFE